MLSERISYLLNKERFSKAFLLFFLVISSLVLFTNTAKALSCKGVWPYVLYELKETVSQPSDSTLFNPTIQVKREETVSSIKCTETFKLKASECKRTSSTLYRYCARYTEPDEHGNDYACNTTEAVYIEGEEVEPATINCNYDDNGESTGSNECPGCRCQCSQRVCAYNDIEGTGLVTEDAHEPYYGSPGQDATTSDDDYRYCCITPPLYWDYMPFHKNEPNPCCGTPSCGGWNYDPCGSSIAGTDGSVVNSSAEHIGCVDIPLGPYPPPLCDPIQGQTPGAVDINICQYSPEYELDSSDPNYPDGNYKQTSIACSDGSTNCESVCELSTTSGKPEDDPVYSTFEKPLVRVFFASTLPLCPNDYVIPETTPTNDNCVQFLNSNLTAEQIWKDKKSLIPVCDEGKTEPDCFSFPSQRTTGPSGSSTTFGTDYKYFKTYYNVFGSSVVSESDTMPYADYSYGVDYTSNPGAAPKAQLAGLYDSYYEDMTDNFNMSSDPEDAYTVDIVDYTSLTRKLISYLNLGEDDSEDGMTLCAYEDSDTMDTLNTIVCAPRPKMFAPTVYSCLEPSDCQYPSGAKPYEQPRINFDVGNPAKSGIIGIDIPTDTSTKTFCVIDDYHTTAATESSDENTDPCTVYKAKLFSAYLTDDNNYELTSDDDGTVTPAPDAETGTYTGGMQYVNNIYCRGATKICLTGYSSPKTVISKIVPLTINGVTTNVASNLISDRVIPPPPAEGEEETYPLPDEILYNPTDNDWYTTSSQPVTNTYFGYMTADPDADPNDPNSYIPQSYCTTGEESSADYIMCTANGAIPDIATESPSNDISCTCSNSTQSSYSCTNSQCQLVWNSTTTSDTNTLSGYQYTDPATGTTTYYSIDQYMKRSLNVMELAQCTDAAKPFCDAITGETVDSPTAEDNGYANWPQTNVDEETEYASCVEGTQPQQDRRSDGTTVDLIPTRYCRYIDQFNSDGTTATQENGCPAYTIAFVTVDNPCAKASLPFWWPSEFLKDKPSIQGAIFNQFNVAPPYEDIFIPKSANYNPYDVQSITLGNNGTTWIEDWYTTSTYNSCKNYQGSRTTSNTKRNVTDGDQEMLHLTEDNWRSLWNRQDLTWLLVDDANNNGCYVYDLGTNINVANATIDLINDGTLKIGMKICKYNNKVSFSLVDLAYNAATDYTNIAYIMQSNIIAYDAYTTQNVTDNVSNEGGFVPKTTITDNNLPKKKNKYHTYLNHGIVIDKNGFDPFETDEVVPGPPPSDFVIMEDAEEIGTSFYFAGVYNWKTSYKDSWGNTKHRDYAKYSFASPYSCGSGDDSSYENEKYDAQKSTNNYPTCALSQYRGAINYSDPDSSTRENISVYLPGPTDIDPLNLTSQQGESANQGGNYSYISRQYWNSCYDGNNMDSSWPYQDGCIQEITVGKDLPGGISGYTYGNSARNVNMFLWKTEKSYDVCNY